MRGTCEHSMSGGTDFGPLKQHLEGCNEEMKVAVPEWLGMQKPNFYYDRIFKVMLRWDKYISVQRDYDEKQWYFSAINKLHLTL